MFRKHSRKTGFKNKIVILLSTSLLMFNFYVQPEVSASTEFDTSEQVELKWYVMGNSQQADTDIVETAINEYLEDKINVTLELETLTWGSDFENKMAAKVESGEEFDITFTANWALNYLKYSKAGAFVDITDMMDTYAPKTKALLGKNILKGAEIDGRVYAIPTYNSIFAKSSGILLNKKLVQKYKVDTTKIKKYEDLESTFKKVKAKEPKIIDFCPFDYNQSYNIYDSLNYEKMIDNRIPGAIKSDGKSTKVINDFETPEVKSLFSLMNRWYNLGYISSSSDSSDFFDNNKSKIFATYSNCYPTQGQEISNYIGVDMIQLDFTKPTLTTNKIDGSMQAISTTSRNPERALMFLELVNTDETLSNMLNYGIEGVHYKKIDSNIQTPLNPDNDSYNPSSSWIFGNMSVAYLYPNQNSNLWDKVNENINKAIPSPLLGFSFNSKPVSKQISKLESITNKYYNNLCIGKTNPSVTLPKMNKELKSAGLQKVLTEMQKQVDAFKVADRK